MSIIHRLIPLLITLPLTLNAAEKPLIFTTAPSQNRLIIENLYRPFIRYLEGALGQPIRFEVESSLSTYTYKMRNDEYDLVFDGPHFAGWRIDVKQHKPLVKLPGQASLVVAASPKAAHLTMADLAQGRARVCVFPQPNILTMAFLKEFPNPLQRPTLLRVQELAELEDCVLSGRGDVLVMQESQWQESPNHAKLSLIDFKSTAYPNRTLTFSHRVATATAEQLKTVLLTPAGAEAASAVLKSYGADRFVEAHLSEYAGLGKLLASEYGFRY